MARIRFIIPLLILLIVVPCLAQDGVYLPLLIINHPRLMAVGDSIVSGGYWLVDLNEDYNKQCGFEYVGMIPLSIDAPARTGYGGATTINYLDNGWHKTAVLAYQPDIVILMLGTNDYTSPYAVASASAGRVQQIIDEIHAISPDTAVFTGIIPRTSADMTAYDAALQTLTNAIYVDQFSQFDPATMTVDGVHPNDIGSQLMADVFFEALVNAGYCRGDYE